jgi:hypothetical protein
MFHFQLPLRLSTLPTRGILTIATRHAGWRNQRDDSCSAFRRSHLVAGGFGRSEGLVERSRTPSTDNVSCRSKQFHVLVEAR